MHIVCEVDQDFHFSLSFLQHMTKLQSDGLELVTNIEIAVDARESDRGTELEETCRLRYMQWNTSLSHYKSLKMYLCKVCIHTKDV